MCLCVLYGIIINMNTSEIRAIADQRFEHALFRKNLRERIEAQLAVAHNGGMFKASKELICFVSLWEETNSDLFIEDMYGNPIKCNCSDLKKKLIEAYQFAMNAWHVDFEKSKKIRNATHV